MNGKREPRRGGELPFTGHRSPFTFLHDFPSDPRFPRRSLHRRHLRHGRGRPTRLSPWPSGVVQSRPGNARDRRAARRPAQSASGGDQPGRPGVRAGAGHLGASPRGGGPLQPTLSAGPGVEVHRAERLHVRRRARLAHPGRRRPRPHQSGTLPARLHGIRRAARHLQALHRDSDPAGSGERLPLRPGRAAPGDHRPGALGPAAVESVQSDRQGDPGGGAGGLGRTRPGSSSARS